MFRFRDLALNLCPSPGGKGTRMSDACTQCLLSFKNSHSRSTHRLSLLRSILSRTIAALLLIASISSISAPLAADEIYAITHCRMVDTRWVPPAGVYLQLGTEYVYNAFLSDNVLQGGEQRSCGIPSNATAIIASLVTVSPAGPGYLKTWDTGGVEPPRATALNFFKAWDAAVANYPISPGRLALIKLSDTGDFSVETYWFGAFLAIDVEGYLAP